MTESGWLLFLSFGIGSIGLALFIYGKKQARIPQLVAGILVMGYPYFVGNVWLMVGIGVVLLLLLWGAVKMGY